MRKSFPEGLLGFLVAAIFLCVAMDFSARQGSPPARQLFNGKDLSGWEQVGPGSFAVETGMLKTEGGMGLLWYPGEKFGNAVLRVVYKVSRPDDNSGVFIRIADRPQDPWFAVHNGYEVQILDQLPPGREELDETHLTGAIYSLSKPIARAAKAIGEWNAMEITLQGQRTVVHLNGVKVNDFRGDQPVPTRKYRYEPIRGQRPDYGYIGLQNHNKESIVYFKEVSVRPLKDEK